MNNNKAPGMDGMTAEILKNGSEKMIDLLEQVIQSVGEREIYDAFNKFPDFFVQAFEIIKSNYTSRLHF